MATTNWSTLGLLVIFSVTSSACGTEDKSVAPHSHGAGKDSKLVLDDGKKWQADGHTRATFSKMHKSVDGFAGTSARDIAALGSTLKGHVGELIAGCTMTGKAHDQLHVFLGDFIPAVDSLAKESAADAAKRNLGSVEHLLADYDKHFE